MFVCVACSHADNADANAARVLKARGIKQLLEGVPTKRQEKPARVRGTTRGKNKVGPVRPEPGDLQGRSTPVENMSDVEAGNRHLGAQASGGR